MFKRIFWFSAVNIAVLLLISVILSVFNVQTYLTGSGIDYQSLLVFSAIIGFAGSFLSLWISKWMAKRAYKILIIDNPANAEQKWLLERVAFYAKKMSIPLPEVGVYQSPEINAFATGASKKSALVAFSVGLLEVMNKEEADGVIGHEMAHIANGDMVTMALVQGVVNTFVIFLSRIAAQIVNNVLFRGRGGFFTYFVVSMIFQAIFGILASPIVCWFSRKREFKADAMSAYYGGKKNMIGGLKKLQEHHEIDKENPGMASMKINGNDLANIFSTHPPLKERIKRLENLKI